MIMIPANIPHRFQMYKTNVIIVTTTDESNHHNSSPHCPYHDLDHFVPW